MTPELTVQDLAYALNVSPRYAQKLVQQYRSIAPTQHPAQAVSDRNRITLTSTEIEDITRFYNLKSHGVPFIRVLQFHFNPHDPLRKDLQAPLPTPAPTDLKETLAILLTEVRELRLIMERHLGPVLPATPVTRPRPAPAPVHPELSTDH